MQHSFQVIGKLCHSYGVDASILSLPVEDARIPDTCRLEDHLQAKTVLLSDWAQASSPWTVCLCLSVSLSLSLCICKVSSPLWHPEGSKDGYPARCSTMTGGIEPNLGLSLGLRAAFHGNLLPVCEEQGKSSQYNYGTRNKSIKATKHIFVSFYRSIFCTTKFQNVLICQANPIK